MDWSDKTILVCGGGGSIGAAVVERLVRLPVHAVRAFDVNEDALFRLKREVPDAKLRTLLGDIRDRERIRMALDGVDVVIQAASVKNVEVSERNVIETIRVNVDGTINLVEQTMQMGPERFLLLSSDKAVEYQTLYGCTKYAQERLVAWASESSLRTRFATARFGNVVETRGNVWSVWAEAKEMNRPLPVTDPGMKRFFMHLHEAADFVLSTVERMENGETHIPFMREYSMGELAQMIGGSTEAIPLRPGEKMREQLIASHEQAEEMEGYWRIRAPS